MILEPFTFIHNTGEEFFIRFEELVKVSRFIVTKTDCLSIHTKDFQKDQAISIRRKEDVLAFEVWLDLCKETVKAFCETQSRPSGAFTTDGNLKFEKKSK